MGPMTVDGNDVDVHSHWTANGGRIVTDATIQPPTGPVVVTPPTAIEKFLPLISMSASTIAPSRLPPSSTYVAVVMPADDSE